MIGGTPMEPWVAGLVAAAFALGLRALAMHRSARDRAAIGDPDLLDRIAPGPGLLRRALAALMLAGGAGLLGAALAAGGFQEADAAEDGSRFETVIVLDASNSMLAEDVRPSRLRLEQLLARRMVGRLSGRIGVVYFAGAGYVLSPLTEDRAATLMFTESVHPTHVGRGGTSMVDGLEQALVVLAGGRRGTERAIILFSDGESTADDPALSLVLERARRGGVAIHAVGLGTAEGARIPMPADSTLGETERRWLRDGSGRIVVSRLEEDVLRQIAGATGGLYAANGPAADALLERIPAGGARPPVSAAAVNGLLLAAFLLLGLEAFVVRRA